MTDFTWSFSSLKEYINCPKKYQEVRILKNYKFIDTPQTIYGKEVHEALELYVRDGKPLAKNYMRFKKMVDLFKSRILGKTFINHGSHFKHRLIDLQTHTLLIHGLRTLHHCVDGVRLKHVHTIDHEDKKEEY